MQIIPLFPAVLANQRHERAGAEIFGLKAVRRARHPNQELRFRVLSDWDHELAADF